MHRENKSHLFLKKRNFIARTDLMYGINILTFKSHTFSNENFSAEKQIINSGKPPATITETRGKMCRFNDA